MEQSVPPISASPASSPAPEADDAVRRRRILFRSTHRGTYENDLLFGGFVRKRLDCFTSDELDAIEAVMDLPDALLADWLTGRQPIPDDLADDPQAGPLLRAMRAAALDGEGRAL
jgi:antitoxin CptB